MINMFKEESEDCIMNCASHTGIVDTSNDSLTIKLIKPYISKCCYCNLRETCFKSTCIICIYKKVCFPTKKPIKELIDNIENNLNELRRLL